MSAALLGGGCARMAPVGMATDRMYAPERDPPRSLAAQWQARDTTWAGATGGCSIHDAGATKLRRAESVLSVLQPLSLSRGDVVNIWILDGSEFNGDYTIGPDGRIALPFVGRIRAAGGDERTLARRIEAALVGNRLFTAGIARVAVRVIRYAAVKVRVRGAVFQPGLHVVNDPRGDKNESEIVEAKSPIRRFGDFTIRRTLTAALRVAAGVRPDADIAQVRITRRGRSRVIDMRGALTGDPVTDPALEDGDEIEMPSRGCFQAELARPSQITPRGIRIYISKMHFAADSRYDEKIPYGLRLLNAAIMASCIGGTLPTRGQREIVLVSRNPATGATEVVQRSVEQLLRDQNRDAINPYLMPDDGVACYDSPLTEAADLASILTTLLSPARLYKSLRGGGD